jgi:hypothetical protein
MKTERSARYFRVIFSHPIETSQPARPGSYKLTARVTSVARDTGSTRDMVNDSP